jgi:hypothetical protein
MIPASVVVWGLKKLWPVLVVTVLLGFVYGRHVSKLNALEADLNASWEAKIEQVRVTQLTTEKNLLEALLANNAQNEALKKQNEIAASTTARNINRMFNSLEASAKSNTAVTTTGLACRTDGAELDSVLRESVQENLYLAREAATLSRRLGRLQLYIKDLERELKKNESVL